MNTPREDDIMIPGMSAVATERHIIHMSTYLRRRFNAPESVVRIAARKLHTEQGFTLSKLERPWGDITTEIVLGAMDSAWDEVL